MDRLRGYPLVAAGPSRVYGRSFRRVSKSLLPVSRVARGTVLQFGKARLERPVTPIWQGNGPGNWNACGTTALAMILNALQAETRSSLEKCPLITREELDAKRPFDSYTAPGTLVKLARAKGFQAALYNEADFEVIKRQLDSGNLLIVLENTEPRHWFSPLHYVVVHGYKDSAVPAERKLLMTNPAYREARKATYEMGYDQFFPYWDRVKIGKVPTGISRFLVIVGNKNSTLPVGRVPFAVYLANGLHNLVNWYAASPFRRAVDFGRKAMASLFQPVIRVLKPIMPKPD